MDGDKKITTEEIDLPDITMEIDLDDIFGDESGEGVGELSDGRGVTDETLILSIDDLGDVADSSRGGEDLDETVVLNKSDIPNPWRDEEDEVLDLFGSTGKTKIYPKDEDVSSETMVLDRKELKKELSEEEAEAENAGEQEAKAEEEEAAQETRGKKRKHYKTHFFLKVGLLLIAVIAVAAFAASPVFTIKHIEVEGNQFYTDEQIINMSGAETGGNLFLDAQKGKIKGNLKENVYFRKVRVKRGIPSTLIIDVDEREELAAVKYGDKYVVIDEDAVVLRVARLDPEVTEITGLTIKKMEVGDQISVEEDKIFQDTIATLHTMKEGDLFFKRIEIEDQKTTAFIYDMLKVNGSSEELRAAIENGNLQKVVNKLMKSKIRRGTIILGDNDYISFSPAV